MGTGDQYNLKAALQAEQSAAKLENLAASLVGRLLGISVAVAKTGFQHGGDAGTAGGQGRRLRLECKKYSDSTSLSDRELLGEIDHAISRDEALEGWILVATRNVPEQLAQDLTQKGERLGIPIVIIDWKENELAPLAALCAFAPDLVELEFSTEAAECARALKPIAGDAIATLRRSLQSWCLGFEPLRARSHDKLSKIWASQRTSIAEFGQDAAGGALTSRIRRHSVHDALNSWWQGSAQNDSPAALIGWDGVGKTWAALDWLIDRLADQPIVMIVPSSAVNLPSGVSELTLKRFIAERLYQLTGVRDSEHWLRRLEYLLKRPKDEGPVITVFFDGLNQEPSAPWLQILKTFQGDSFESRVRLIMSTRSLHFEGRLSHLRGLVVAAAKITVGVYDLAPGGELDRMLAFEGLRQSDLHPDLIDLVRTPRLFNLVLRFRDRLVETGRVTVHRLLWEYGRDTLGVRGGKSFSEEEWRAWLAELADRYRGGARRYSFQTLGEMTQRADLSEREVYARLSDIIDGRFATSDGSGGIQLNPIVVTHALAAALLSHLDAEGAGTYSAAEGTLTHWLDPIASLDQRAEILRAAVSIMLERGSDTSTHIAGALVTAWIQSRNITDAHRLELGLLAPSIPEALLDAIEHSEADAQLSARAWAVNALREIPRNKGAVLDVIVTRLRAWLGLVSRQISPSQLQDQSSAHVEFERQRSERYKTRIGVDASGSIRVLGVDLTLTDWDDGRLQSLVPSILDGFPLSETLPCFEVAAVAGTVRESGAWDGLKWLCYLNERDPDAMTHALRELSAELQLRKPEFGIHPELPARAAALVLWLTGHETDEQKASCINPSFAGNFSYEEDYLANPSKSYFAVERRHVDLVLLDAERPLHVRIQRTCDFWVDPTFKPPQEFVEEFRKAMNSYDIETLNQSVGPTPQDHFFEQLEPVLARCAPDLLVALIRRKLEALDACPTDARYWVAIRSTDYFLLATDKAAWAAQTLRLRGHEKDEMQEAIAASDLLKIELARLPDAMSQFERTISADLRIIPVDFRWVLQVASAEEIESLITKFGHGSPKERKDLVLLLSIHPMQFSDSTWSYLSNLALQPGYELQHVLFRMLAIADGARFGRILAAEGWSWNPKADFWVNHYGSAALIAAESALPFDQLTPRLAPWRLLEAARVRGGDPVEIRLAAEVLGNILTGQQMNEPDLGSTLTVDLTVRGFPYFVTSARPKATQDGLGDPASSLRAALDIESRAKAEMRAYETAIARIAEARSAGASLYLATMEARDMELVLRHASDLVDGWLEGCPERTSAFIARLHLAEPAFLTLCEALLTFDPVRGADLWRALRSNMLTQYVGAADVNELLHIAFRAPDSPAAAALRAEIIGLPQCNTDHDVLNAAVSAILAKKQGWLKSKAAEDNLSSLVWRNRRGILLDGLSINNPLPVAEAWPEGKIGTERAALRRKSASMRWTEACARHWWNSFVAADNSVEAYAAWVLFLRSADARDWAWIRTDLDASNSQSKFNRLKLAHMELNIPELERAMKKRFERLESKFLDHDIVEGISPWRRLQANSGAVRTSTPGS